MRRSRRLGLLLVQSGEVEQAIHHLARAGKLAVRVPGDRNNLANALRQAGRFGDAEREWRTAVELDPTDAHAWLGVVTSRTALDDSAGALEGAWRARALRPEGMGLDRSETTALAAADPMEGSVGLLERAVARDPGSASLRSSLLMQLNFLDRPATAIADAHRADAACVRGAPSPPQLDRDPARLLRLGVLSGDLRSHSVASLADPIVRHLPTGWHLPAFSTSRPTSGDPLAAELRRLAGACRPRRSSTAPRGRPASTRRSARRGGGDAGTKRRAVISRGSAETAPHAAVSDPNPPSPSTPSETSVVELDDRPGSPDRGEGEFRLDHAASKGWFSFARVRNRKYRPGAVTAGSPPPFPRLRFRPEPPPHASRLHPPPCPCSPRGVVLGGRPGSSFAVHHAMLSVIVSTITASLIAGGVHGRPPVSSRVRRRSGRATSFSSGE